jgi:hypothetical protein
MQSPLSSVRWARCCAPTGSAVCGAMRSSSAATVPASRRPTTTLIGELAGLYVAGATWPFWPEARLWRRAGRDGLEREVLRQCTVDGVHKEQSTGYQQFVWDFLLLAGWRRGGRASPFPPTTGSAWRPCSSTWRHHGCGWQRPSFGDADDGVVSGLSLAAGGALPFPACHRCPVRQSVPGAQGRGAGHAHGVAAGGGCLLTLRHLVAEGGACDPPHGFPGRGCSCWGAGWTRPTSSGGGCGAAGPRGRCRPWPRGCLVLHPVRGGPAVSD